VKTVGLSTIMQRGGTQQEVSATGSKQGHELDRAQLLEEEQRQLEQMKVS